MYNVRFFKILLDWLQESENYFWADMDEAFPGVNRKAIYYSACFNSCQ